MNFLFLILAILLICLAHWIRILRWGLFIGVYEKPKKKILVQSLSIGYLISYFLPYKLGDLARAWISGRKMRNGKALGFSTVIVDRYLDIVAVGFLFLLLYLPDQGNTAARRTVFLYFGTAVAALGLAGILILLKTSVKRWILAFTSIFNEQIQSRLLRSIWALIWGFKNVALKISKIKLAASTCGMWAAYLLSYFFYAQFLSASGIPTSW
ncbi:MAG: flippase-like domain-containing protein, partial [Lachnospiraceae bacterium]|nr:flippase-like domain-containing protein [Lachnospiraceae bacterium]